MDDLTTHLKETAAAMGQALVEQLPGVPGAVEVIHGQLGDTVCLRYSRGTVAEARCFYCDARLTKAEAEASLGANPRCDRHKERL